MEVGFCFAIMPEPTAGPREGCVRLRTRRPGTLDTLEARSKIGLRFGGGRGMELP